MEGGGGIINNKQPFFPPKNDYLAIVNDKFALVDCHFGSRKRKIYKWPAFVDSLVCSRMPPIRCEEITKVIFLVQNGENLPSVFSLLNGILTKGTSGNSVVPDQIPQNAIKNSRKTRYCKTPFTNSCPLINYPNPVAIKELTLQHYDNCSKRYFDFFYYYYFFIFIFILLLFSEKKAWPFLWIVCQTDDFCKMSSLIFS